MKVKTRIVYAGAPQRQDYRTPLSLRTQVIEFARAHRVEVLDPCAGVHRADHWCDRNFTKAGDGMNADWSVSPFVFANLEYQDAKAWAERMFVMRSRVELGVYLVPNYSDTSWFCSMVDASRSVVTFKGRLSFELPFKDRRARQAKGLKVKPTPARFASAMIAFGSSTALHAAWAHWWMGNERARVWVPARRMSSIVDRPTALVALPAATTRG